MQRDGENRTQALFAALMFSLHAAGMQQLGKIMNPMTGKIERDLEQAQATIEMMEMLKQKTVGNLDEFESKLIARLLAELQMNYVDEANRDQKAGTSESPDSKNLSGEAKQGE